MVRSAAGKPIDKPEKLWIIINIKKVSIVHPHAVARRDIERFFGLFTTSNPVINDVIFRESFIVFLSIFLEC